MSAEKKKTTPLGKSEGAEPERFIPDGMGMFQRNVKRIGDCALAFLALIVFSPLFLLCYIAVKREDGGPLYRTMCSTVASALPANIFFPYKSPTHYPWGFFRSGLMEKNLNVDRPGHHPE